MRLATGSETLRRMFAGLAEDAFLTNVGLADPILIDYVSDLLARFIHHDAVYRLRDGQGRQLHEVADMVIEAEALPTEGRVRREYHRHIGDFTLFWTGLFPDAVQRMRSAQHKDYFINYIEQGKRSYSIAGSGEENIPEVPCAILRRLSKEFELCALGLHHVRREFALVQNGLETSDE